MIYTKNTDTEKPVKEKEYMDYIDKHIANVLDSFNKYIDKPDIVIPGYDLQRSIQIIDRLYPDVMNHDSSKYSEEEFNPYRRHFYPTEAEKKAGESKLDEQNFDNACLHHYVSNPHHPDFFRWVTITEKDIYGCPLSITVNDKPHDPLDMDDVDIIHMLCDWKSMTYNPGASSIQEYWKTSDIRKSMSKNTIERVDQLLSFFFGK